MSILNIFLIFLLRTFSNLVKSEFVNSCSEKNTVALTVMYLSLLYIKNKYF